MATKNKKVLYSKYAARWYLDTGKELAYVKGLYARDADVEERANYLAEKRAIRLATLSRDVKNIRSFFRGFDSKDGFSLKEIQRWPASRVKKVEAYSVYLKNAQSQNYQRVIPRTKKQEKGLRALTGQLYEDQRAFLVHVPDTGRDKIAFDTHGNVIRQRELTNQEKTTIYDIFYLFVPLIGWRPATWDDIPGEESTGVVSATEQILPFLPDDESLYFFYSELHGMIGGGATKRMLLHLARRYAIEYSLKDFADTLIGFQRVFSSTQGRMLAERKLSHRQKRIEERNKAWNALRRKIRKKLGRRKL